MKATPPTSSARPSGPKAESLVVPTGHFAGRAARMFEKIYGCRPCYAASAPGRVNLIGEHTDYNDGFVLPMTIERQTFLLGEPSDDQTVNLHSLTVGESASFSLRGGVQRGEPAWSNYVRGVVAGFQKLKLPVPGFNAVIDSNVPLGGGLSSSAALEVSVATFLEALTGRQLEPVQKALLCQQAEHEFAGVPCGIMDQFVAVLGKKDHLLLLDCRSRTTKLVPLPDPTVALLIINTNVRHQLADGEYAARRAQCEQAARMLKVKALRDVTLEQLQRAAAKLDPVDFRRARHVITENERTLRAAERLQAGDWLALGELMYASHDSLRDDYEVSCQELDVVVETARSIGPQGGVFGCRMTGGGFGGCAVALVKASEDEHIRRLIMQGYEHATQNLASIFATRPAPGAHILTAADFQAAG